MISSRLSALLLALACSAQMAVPAYAQSTMLTGVVERPVTVTRVQPGYVPMYPRYGTYAPAPVQRPAIVQAAPRTYVRTVYVQDRRTYWQRHPMIKKATIGAGIGAGVGAVTGLVTHRGVLRGAAIGAGTGATIGVIRASRIMRRHPIIRDVATGAVAGLGLGWAGTRRHGRIGQFTGVGAALGLGVGLWKHLR